MSWGREKDGRRTLDPGQMRGRSPDGGRLGTQQRFYEAQPVGQFIGR